jgi:hypothetical protein
MNLSERERSYLARHNVSLDEVIDVGDMSPKTYKPLMKELGAIVAINAGRCTQRHSMRFRSGHCAECNPQNFGFIRRWQGRGTVYVAWSVRHQLAKVGAAFPYAHSRVDELNRRSYADIGDWNLRHSVDCLYAGKVEHAAQRFLATFYEPRSYHWAGREIGCYEVFKCSLKLAMDALDEAAASYDVPD